VGAAGGAGEVAVAVAAAGAGGEAAGRRAKAVEVSAGCWRSGEAVGSPARARAHGGRRSGVSRREELAGGPRGQRKYIQNSLVQRLSTTARVEPMQPSAIA